MNPAATIIYSVDNDESDMKMIMGFTIQKFRP